MLTMSGFLKKELLHKGQLGVKYMDIPEEYQVLTWIKKGKSNGYLDTKYIANAKSIIRTTMILDQWFSDTTNRVMGASMYNDSALVTVGINGKGSSAGSRTLYAYHSDKNKDKMVCSTCNEETKLNTIYELDCSFSGFYVNGKRVDSELQLKKDPDSDLTLSFYLFCVNLPSGAESNSYKKEIAGGFKRTQIFEGSTLIKDMIPVYNKTTKYYGMYDVVNKEFLPASNKTAFFGE